MRRCSGAFGIGWKAAQQRRIQKHFVQNTVGEAVSFPYSATFSMVGSTTFR